MWQGTAFKLRIVKTLYKLSKLPKNINCLFKLDHKNRMRKWLQKNLNMNENSK